jgi:hypothetical protein
MKQEMAGRDWNELLKDMSADQAWDMLKKHVHQLIAKHVPERRRRNNNRPPWLNRDILRAIRRKKRLWRAAKQG